MATKNNNKECPFCKEEIKKEAIKCKHCASSIPSEEPAHEGTCPYCKEKIHMEAIKCKHCKSSLKTSSNSNCDCSDSDNDKSNLVAMLARNILDPHGPYQECYLDCDYDYSDGSLDHNLCQKRCDRRHDNPLLRILQLARLSQTVGLSRR